MASRSYFGKMNSTLGSVVPLAMFKFSTVTLIIMITTTIAINITTATIIIASVPLLISSASSHSDVSFRRPWAKYYLVGPALGQVLPPTFHKLLQGFGP